MPLFNDLKLSKDKNKNIKITFDGKPFITINQNTVFEIINKYATNAFINKVSKLVKTETLDNDLLIEANDFEATFTKMKIKFYGRKNIKRIAKISRAYQDIVRATKLAIEYDISNKDFIQIHIDGLAFVNDNKGAFPKPSQLYSEAGIQRVLEYIREDDNENSSNFKAIELTYADLNTTLEENAKWQRYYARIADGSATLREATYCNDVCCAVRDRADARIVEYIESFDE